MSITIIIALCALLLFAYVFDITSSKTRIPSVILLLILGWSVRQGTEFFGLALPDFNPVLPYLGTFGLILIVLDGSLELELNKSKFPIIGKSSILALLPMLIFSLVMAFGLESFANTTFKIGLANAIPLAIISSAIAIPSARHLIKADREFITYESSLSDIYGVIFFNFITTNDNIGTGSVGWFLLQLLIIIVVSFLATTGLSLVLSKTRQTVKFAPIILLIVLIYLISKMYHLPALIFIMLLGLFMGNLDELQKFKFIKVVRPDILQGEVTKFKEITAELTFLIRSLFFLLFGFLINTEELLNPDSALWAVIISASIYIIKALHLWVMKLPMNPLLSIAPRGLITILLYISIPAAQSIPFVNKSLIIQVIVITTCVMMFGTLKRKRSPVVASPD